MRLIGNIIWIITGGLITAIEYVLISLILFITIIGIPFGLETIKMAKLSLLPFSFQLGKQEEISSTSLNFIMNIIWICLSHIILGGLLFITIIGIPFGKQHFKLARLSLSPFGRSVIDRI